MHRTFLRLAALLSLSFLLQGDDPVRLQSVAPGVADLRELNPEAAAADIHGILSSKPNTEGTAEIFRRYRWEEVAPLAKNRQLSENTIQELAQQRRGMIEHAFADVLEELHQKYPNNGLEIGILDSGNKASGIASDIDQTI